MTHTGESKEISEPIPLDRSWPGWSHIPIPEDGDGDNTLESHGGKSKYFPKENKSSIHRKKKV